MQKYQPLQNKSKFSLIFLIILLGCSISTTPLVLSRTHWGGSTHGDIARNAIFSLPSPWKEFFTEYSPFLIDHSNDPDEYRSWCSGNDAYLYAAERARHYDDHNIKVDGGDIYNESLPQNSHLIDSKYTIEDQDFISYNVPVSSIKYKKGVIEWTVSNFTQTLTYYMSIASENPSNNTAWQLILTSMSWLSHYVADATMPFHATANYDGQLTDQWGIHSAVESYLIPSFSREISFSHSQASYTPSAFNQTIVSIESGLALVSQILEADNQFAPDGNRDNDWQESMWDELHYELSGRVDLASVYTANLWYTSLIDSGMITHLNSTDLNLISIDLSDIPDPWRPVIALNTSVTTTTSSTTALTNSSSTSTDNNTSSQEITSWRLSPIFFLISLSFLVKRKKMRSKRVP